MTSVTVRNSTNHQIGLSIQGIFYSKKEKKNPQTNTQTNKKPLQQPQPRPDLICLIDLEIFERKFIILLLTIIIVGIYKRPVNLLNWS